MERRKNNQPIQAFCINGVLKIKIKVNPRAINFICKNVFKKTNAEKIAQRKKIELQKNFNKVVRTFGQKFDDTFNSQESLVELILNKIEKADISVFEIQPEDFVYQPPQHTLLSVVIKSDKFSIRNCDDYREYLLRAREVLLLAGPEMVSYSQKAGLCFQVGEPVVIPISHVEITKKENLTSQVFMVYSI